MQASSVLHQNNKKLEQTLSASAADIILEKNKRLHQQFIVLRNLVNQLSALLHTIEKKADRIRLYAEVGYDLQCTVSVTCLEQVIDYLFSEEKYETRLTLKSIFTELASISSIIDKVEAIYKVIETEGFSASRYENILEDTINKNPISKIKNHIVTANKILERQNQLLKQANLELIYAKRTLSNNIKHFSKNKNSYFESRENKYNEKIRDLEEQKKIDDMEIKDFLIPYKESMKKKHACFQRGFLKYQDDLELRLKEDEKSWVSCFISWVSQYVPCIKNTKRDLLKAEKISAIMLITNYKAHCDTLYNVMDQSEKSITPFIVKSKTMLVTYKNQYFDFAYSQLIQDSNVVEICCQQYQVEKIETTREIQANVKERNELNAEKAKCLNRLYADLDKVNKLIDLHMNDNLQPIDNIDDRKKTVPNLSNGDLVKQTLLTLSLLGHSFFNKISEIVSPTIETKEIELNPLKHN